MLICRLVLALALAALCLLFPSKLSAGAWTSDKGHGQIIVTGSFFQTTKNFDKGGTARTFDYHGRFRQTSVESYLEYGLAKRTTLVLKVPVEFLDYSNQYGAMHSSGSGDVEIACRERFNSLESPWALSAQLAVAVPAYPAQRNPAPGNHQEDVEARFLLGRSLKRARHHAFWDAEAAYRYRSGAPADQVRADLTAGIDLSRRVMLLGQSFLTFGLRNGVPSTEITNPNAQSDFDLYKGQVSLVIRLGRGTRLQAGWNDAFAGRNTGQGSTAMLAIWKTF